MMHVFKDTVSECMLRQSEASGLTLRTLDLRNILHVKQPFHLIYAQSSFMVAKVLLEGGRRTQVTPEEIQRSKRGNLITFTKTKDVP